MSKTPNSLKDVKEAFELIKHSLNSAKVGISHISFTGDILWANEIALEYMGVESTNYLGINFKQLNKPEDFARQLKNWNKLRTGEVESLSIDKAFLKKDGSFFWGNISITAQRNKNGEPEFIVAVYNDINKRKESENFLNMVLRALPSLISYIDKDLKYRFVNQSYERWFGLPYKEIVGKSLIDVIGPTAFEQAQPHLARALKGEYVEYERRLDYKFGGAREVHVSFIPDLNPIGEVLGFVVVVNDVTEIKNVQEFNEEQHSRIYEAAKLSVVGSIASAVSHQISGPLEALNAKIDQMQARIDKLEEQNRKLFREDLLKIQNSSYHISNVVKGLRSISRNPFEESFIEHNLSLVIEDALSFCKERFQEKGIEILLEDPKDLRVKCKPTQISQVILNLLNNSCDAIEKLDSKWIKINVVEEANCIQIAVTDSGPGLAHEVVSQMMSPFFSTKKGTKVSGLGLSDSRDIIESHGGNFFYDSSGNNTRFIIELLREQKYATIKGE